MFFSLYFLHDHLRKIVIIAAFIFLSCESYNIRPLVVHQDVKNNISKIIVNYKFDFIYLQSKNLKNPIVNSLKKLKFKEINEINQFSNNNYNLEIKIRYIGPFGTGIGIISVVSLGLIPTYLSEHDKYEIKFILYKGKNKLQEKEYILRMKQFNWIFVAPGGVGNNCRRNKIIDLIVQDFFHLSKFNE